MGMSSREYNTIMYPDLMAKINGFRNRRKHDEQLMREVGWSAIISGRVAHSKEFYKSKMEYWPIDGDPEPSDIDPEGGGFESKKGAYKQLIDKVNGKI